MSTWSWLSRKRRELDEEIQAHLDMATRDRIERGETPEAAGLAAPCQTRPAPRSSPTTSTLRMLSA